MTILEVGLQSGLSLSPDGIETDGYVKKVETPPGKVIVYLDSVSLASTVLLLSRDNVVNMNVSPGDDEREVSAGSSVHGAQGGQSPGSSRCHLRLL